MIGNYSLEPVFVPGQYTLTLNVEGDGTVAKDPDAVGYDFGTVVTLTADPDEGWTFAGWSGDASGTELEIDVEIITDMVVNATFVDLFSLEILVDGEGTIVYAVTGGVDQLAELLERL